MTAATAPGAARGRAREVGVGGSGLELTLRNNLNQRALARECAEWIREKGVFKSAKTSGAIQPGGTYVVENPSGDDHAFMGAAANFTQEGLGYERRPGTVTCVSHFENATEAVGLKMMFESVWDNPAMVEEVTAQVAAQVETLYRENPPEFIYFLTLYHLVATGMVDDKGAVTPELKAAAEEGKVELPAELEPAKEQVEAIIIHKSQRVQIRDKAKEVSVELQKDVTLDPAFQALWDRIRQRTRFQVEVDSGKLIEHAIEAVDGMLAVRPPQVTSERASLGIDDAGVSAEGTGTSVVSVSGKVKYDLPDPIAELQDAVGLTRGTIKAILEGCSRLDEFEIDPATFLAQVGDKINRVKNDLIAQGIKYVRLPEDEWYTMRDLELDDYTAYLGQNAWKPDMTSKSLYNYVVYDSAGVERSFAEALDKQEEVLVFAKLPSAFKIDTPLGSYNPDWAYVEEADGERRVYFVTETKGGKNGEPALRDAEKIKIGCAKKHFEALDLGNDFHYNVRTTYQYEAVKA